MWFSVIKCFHEAILEHAGEVQFALLYEVRSQCEARSIAEEYDGLGEGIQETLHMGLLQVPPGNGQQTGTEYCRLVRK